MPLATQERSEPPEQFTRTADNSALYTALTEAVGGSNISEKAGCLIEPDYRLIRVDNRLVASCGHGFEIALVDDAEFSVAYYARVTQLQIPEAGSRLVARYKLWRSTSVRHSQVLSEISQTVLFKYIVHDYNLFLTDEAVTGDGKFYWFRQMSRAIELDLHVYAYDPKTRALRPISTQRALADMQEQVWSDTAPECLRAIISIFPLDRQ